MDKAGNFIGWLHIDSANLSVLLVEHALSKVHFTAERSSYYKSLLSAEEAAKQKKEKVPGWNWAWLGRGRVPPWISDFFSPSCPSPKTPQPPHSGQSSFVVPHLRDPGWCWSQTPRQEPHATKGGAASIGILSPRPPLVGLVQENGVWKVTLQP